MRTRGVVPAAVALIAASPAAHAGGQLVGDNGAQGMQRAGAFAAKADDPTAVYYNPAGLAGFTGVQLFVGLNVVHMTQRFERGGAYAEQPVYPDPQPDYVGDPFPRVEHRGAQPVPLLAARVSIGSKLGAGVAVFAPQGHPGREYPDQVMTASGHLAPAPQRYDVVSQSGGVVFPSVAFGYAVGPRVRVGARASWGVAWVDSTKVVQGQPNPSERPEQDSRVTVSARDWFAFTYGLGAHVRLSPAFEIAAAYSAATRVHARGTASTEMGELVRHPGDGVDNTLAPVDDAAARCGPGGTPDAIRACVAFSLPDAATLSARWILRDAAGRERADVEVDVRWERWSVASDYTIVTDGVSELSSEGDVLAERPLYDTVVRHNLDDVLSVRLGGAAAASPGVRVRAGIAYDTAAAAPSWSRLDLDGGARLTVAGGVGLDVDAIGGRVDVGVGYVYLPDRIVEDQPISDVSDVSLRVQPDVAVPLLERDAQPHHPFNAGVHHSRYAIASVGVTVTW